MTEDTVHAEQESNQTLTWMIQADMKMNCWQKHVF